MRELQGTLATRESVGSYGVCTFNFVEALITTNTGILL